MSCFLFTILNPSAYVFKLKKKLKPDVYNGWTAGSLYNKHKIWQSGYISILHHIQNFLKCAHEFLIESAIHTSRTWISNNLLSWTDCFNPSLTSCYAAISKRSKSKTLKWIRNYFHYIVFWKPGFRVGQQNLQTWLKYGSKAIFNAIQIKNVINDILLAQAIKLYILNNYHNKISHFKSLSLWKWTH